jgi:hypothetical protein
MTDHEAHDAAERFWDRAKVRESYPRTLERTVLRVLPLVVVKLPGLGVRAIRQWLCERGVQVGALAPDRGLRGGLFARGGVAVVFLDGTDTADEARFSLAHEVAHFLLDYLWPREAAIEAMGERVRDVLDGLRPASAEERLSAVLRRVKLGAFTHLMDRDGFGRISSAGVMEAEDRADRLALELLAPRAAVAADAARSGVQLSDAGGTDAVSELLVAKYGLPAPCAERYARHLLSRHQGRGSFREWLGVKKKLGPRRRSPDRPEYGDGGEAR